ncbi:interferon-induced protein 44-like [Anabas testudineus]|uniref:Uncharacterized protein n=1 Tax=Anabas testudineus TaxID=64144 RepID=A0A3Q1HA27_ANATE|nr:interferon-induced protein 44-like [Anabas testudineus]
MGGNQSKSEAATPQFLSKEWRKIDWGKDQSVLQTLKNYKPEGKHQQLRILLHGPVGAGKSSFINSIQSVLLGRMYKHALAANVFENCFTKKYITYKLKESPSTFSSIVFSDIMGLGPDKGIPVRDIVLAMKGHVKEGYTFNPESPLSEGDVFYNSNPGPNDKVHVLVCVVPANTVSQIRGSVVQKIREVRAEASRLGIPQLIILTKIDEVCPEIKEDLRNVYKIKYLKEKMELFSVEVGIPMNCIFPVKCYHEEIELNSDVNSLILSALRDMIHAGEDHIHFNQSRSELLDAP